MNWVSYAEDIEELRQQNAHIQEGLDALIRRLHTSPPWSDVKQLEADLASLTEALIKHCEGLKVEARKKLDKAIRFVSDPAVRITGKLEKATRQRNEVRDQAHDLRTQLEKCRAAEERSQKNIRELKREREALEKELSRLRDDAYVAKSLGDVRPLRKK